MHCPACKTVPFLPVKLDGSLPALGCPDCDGAFVSLLYYRDWAERTGRGAAGDASPAAREVAVRANDTAKALACPKCSRIMTKFRIAGGVTNRIDLCATCDEAFLERLAQLVGSEDVAQADAVRDWLHGHPQRAALLAYLSQS